MPKANGVAHARHNLSTSPCGWSPEPAHAPSLLHAWRPIAAGEPGGVLAIVPGVADSTRARITLVNLKHLKPRGCIVFTHKPCGSDPRLDAMLDAGPRPPLASRCDVYRAPNGPRGGYVQHLKRVLPIFVEAIGFSHVLVLLDDVLATSISLPRLLRVMAHNELSWASPAVEGAHDEVALPRNASELKRLGAPEGAIGRVVRLAIASRGILDSFLRVCVMSACMLCPLVTRVAVSWPSDPIPLSPTLMSDQVHRIESFAWLMTPPMYRCLHTLIDPALNGVGWGYDHWLYLYCRSWPSVRGCSTALHTVQNCSTPLLYTSRTDTTP